MKSEIHSFYALTEWWSQQISYYPSNYEYLCMQPKDLKVPTCKWASNRLRKWWWQNGIQSCNLLLPNSRQYWSATLHPGHCSAGDDLNCVRLSIARTAFPVGDSLEWKSHNSNPTFMWIWQLNSTPLVNLKFVVNDRKRYNNNNLLLLYLLIFVTSFLFFLSISFYSISI
jgi:hypothetical protein